MIVNFGIHAILLLSPVQATPPPPPPPPVQVVSIDAVVIERPTINGAVDPSLQGPEDAVQCSYVSDGTPGTGEEGVEYPFETGQAEAGTNALDCEPAS